MSRAERAREDGVHYWSEALDHGRAQLRRDVVIDGELVDILSEPLGSPAPAVEVEAFARHLTSR